jgi:hypothetical protein
MVKILSYIPGPRFDIRGNNATKTKHAALNFNYCKLSINGQERLQIGWTLIIFFREFEDNRPGTVLKICTKKKAFCEMLHSA